MRTGLSIGFVIAEPIVKMRAVLAFGANGKKPLIKLLIAKINKVTPVKRLMRCRGLVIKKYIPKINSPKARNQARSE